MFAASSWAAAAGGAYVFDKGEGADIPPWTPDIVTAIDEYVPSPTFSSGHFNLDHFAAANSLDQQGLVTAQLANGDMVVAGLVPDGIGGGFCGDGTKLCSIGLVRYNANGQRITWPNAGANGRFSNNYVVWPGGVAGNYQYLRHVSVRGNLIDVLADRPDFGRTGLGRADVLIATFRDTGAFVGFGTAFGASGSGTESEDFYGAQMIQMNSTTMIVAATAYDSVGPYVAVTRLVTDINQSPTKDATWGFPYNPAPNTFFANRLNRYYPPNNTCAASPCKATAGYVVKPVGNTFADFYVSGSVQFNGNDWDVATLKISSLDGALKPEFGTDGWVTTQFDQAGSTNKDLAAGLYVYDAEVYLAAQVAQKCNDGIGMAKISGSTGSLIGAFGPGGKIVFGGQGNLPTCFFQGTGPDVPFAISATGGRIGIAGYRGYRGFNNSYSVNPMLAVVNAVNGTVLDIASHPVTRPDGTRFGDAVLYGIYGGPLATSPFTVAGNGRDASAGNTLSYVAGRLIPVSSDRIFASGFD